MIPRIIDLPSDITGIQQYLAWYGGELVNSLESGRTLKTRTMTKSITLQKDDDVIICTATGTITLPIGHDLIIHRIRYIKNRSGGIVTIEPGTDETINGGASIEVADGESVRLVYGDGNWESL